MTEMIKLMSGTTPEMLHVDYWLKRCSGVRTERMTQQQIKTFNQRNLHKLAGEHILYDLAGLFDVYGYGVCVRRCIIWKTPHQIEPLSAIYVNEPVAVLDSKEGWYKIRCIYYEGWVCEECIALCADRLEWLQWQDMQKFLLITGDYIELPHRAAQQGTNAELAGLRLDMGVRLALVGSCAGKSVPGMYNNYIVRIPLRTERGRLTCAEAGIPVSCDVHMGYLAYSRENVLRQAFKTLGDVYGWGGSLYSRDCSALVMDVYRCFGILLPRDVSGQMKITACASIESGPEATAGLCQLKPGDILGFPGHTMLYAGYAGTHYVISAVGGIYTSAGRCSSEEQKTETACRLSPVRADSCVVSDLNVYRQDGRTWRESLTYIKIIAGKYIVCVS